MSGAYAAVVTPFTSHGTPDPGQVTDLVLHLKNRDCKGILVGGSTGEAQSLSVKERREVMSAAAHASSGLSLLIGTGAASLEDSVDLTRAAYEHNIDAVVVIPPFFYISVTDDGLVAYFSELINRAVPRDGKVLLYHNPILTSTFVTTNLIRKLVDAFPNQVVGIKDSGSDLDYTTALSKEFPNLEILVGDDRLLLSALELGAAGAITGLSNLFPDFLNDVYSAYRAGKSGAAQQERLSDLYQKLDGLPRIAAIKAVLVAGNVIANAEVRPPLRSLTSMEVDLLRDRFNFESRPDHFMSRNSAARGSK